MKKRMNYRTSAPLTSIIFLICLTAVIFTIPFTSCKKENKTIPADTVKTMAVDFSLKALNGDTFHLSDQRGKVVVLFFFGFGCPYCKESAPGIQEKLVEPYASKSGYIVVGLDMWNGSHSAVESFKNTTGLMIPMLLEASTVGKEYGTAYDRLIVIDKEGYIRFRGTQSAIKDIDTVMQTVSQLITP